MPWEGRSLGNRNFFVSQHLEGLTGLGEFPADAWKQRTQELLRPTAVASILQVGDDGRESLSPRVIEPHQGESLVDSSQKNPDFEDEQTLAIGRFKRTLSAAHPGSSRSLRFGTGFFSPGTYIIVSNTFT